MAVSLLQVQGATQTNISHRQRRHRVRTRERHCGLSATSTEASQRCSAPPQQWVQGREASCSRSSSGPDLAACFQV